MPERLTPAEVRLLDADSARTPMHVGTVFVLDGTDGLDHRTLLDLVRDRLAYVPRYRKRVLRVPGALAAPVWVDEADFDPGWHVRRAVLPSPGRWEQVAEFAARVLARRLDPDRPLWELYLVEGLADGGLAVVSKTHLALVDNIDNVDLAQVLFDTEPTPAPDPSEPTDGWQPVPEPNAFDLVAGAVWESAQDLPLAAQNLRGSVVASLGFAVAVGEWVLGAGPDPVGSGPLVGPVSEGRRVGLDRFPLAELADIRATHGVTVHDAMLSIVAGGLRRWLLSRGESVLTERSLTGLAPVAVPEADGALTALGFSIEPRLVNLPVDEPDARLRLMQVAAERARTFDPVRSVSAETLAATPGGVPPTVHALAARAVADAGGDSFDLTFTNVPGSPEPLYLTCAPVTACHPVAPLTGGHRVNLAMTTYRGEVFLGLTVDAVTVDDVRVLQDCLTAARKELREAVGP